MTKIGKKRLLKLADHLEHGKLSVEHFTLTVFYGKTEAGITYGDALGQCPKVFPKFWQMVNYGSGRFSKEPVLKKLRTADKDYSVINSASVFFGIEHEEVQRLFWHGGRSYANPKNYLGLKASRETVANNIRAFVKHKEQEAACE